MNIKDALNISLSGKVTMVLDGGEEVKYAMWRGEEGIWWVDEETGKWDKEVGHLDLLEGWWKPYHGMKEIRPEKAGELWEYGINAYPHYIVDIDNELCLMWIDGTHVKVKNSNNPVIHGKDGWIRIRPSVEEEYEKDLLDELLPDEEWEDCDDEIKGTVLDSIIKILIRSTKMK